jgi:hypothetical protein
LFGVHDGELLDVEVPVAGVHPEGPAVGRLRTVVRQEDDERLVQLAHLTQVVEQPADVEVQVGHHGGVELHPASLGLLHVLREIAPGGNRGEPRIGVHVLLHQAAALHAQQPRLADGVVAVVVAARVALAPVLGDGQGAVGRLVGEVGEEGTAVGAVRLDALQHEVREVAGRVVVFGELVQ